jgi:hypothetical protein
MHWTMDVNYGQNGFPASNPHYIMYIHAPSLHRHVHIVRTLLTALLCPQPFPVHSHFLSTALPCPQIFSIHSPSLSIALPYRQPFLSTFLLFPTTALLYRQTFPIDSPSLPASLYPIHPYPYLCLVPMTLWKPNLFLFTVLIFPQSFPQHKNLLSI